MFEGLYGLSLDEEYLGTAADCGDVSADRPRGRDELRSERRDSICF